MTYTVHPAAAVFPAMNDADLKELANDIGEHGLHQPLILTHDESVLVDGRNRLRACEIAGVDFTTETLPEDYTDEQTIDYIVSANIRRRHLTAGQKAMLAAELEPMYAEAARERQREGGREHGRGQEEKVMANSPQPIPEETKSREQAAKAVGASGRSVSDAKALKQDAPDLAEQVSNGDMSLNEATKERKRRQPKPPPAPRGNRKPELLDAIRQRLEAGEVVNEEEMVALFGVSKGTVGSARSHVEGQIKAEAEAAPDYATAPMSAQAKVDAMVRRRTKELEKQFHTRLLAEMDQYRARCDANVATHKAKLDAETERERALRDEERERYKLGIEVQRAKGLITPADYDLIRSCLHPDSRLSVSDEKLATAFRVFNDSRIRTLLVKEK